MPDPVIAVEDRHREQHRAELPGPEEDRGCLGSGRQDDGDPVAALDPRVSQHVRRLVRQRLKLAPLELAHLAVVALVDHRELFRIVLVADVGGDVVALGHVPDVLGASLLVTFMGHAVHVPTSAATSSSQPSRWCVALLVPAVAPADDRQVQGHGRRRRQRDGSFQGGSKHGKRKSPGEGGLEGARRDLRRRGRADQDAVLRHREGQEERNLPARRNRFDGYRDLPGGDDRHRRNRLGNAQAEG